MGASVQIFNTSSTDMSVIINDGNPIAAAGTGPVQGWQPQATQAGQTSQMAAPGVLGMMGGNQVLVLSNGSPLGAPFLLKLPTNVQINSVQIYLAASQGGGGLWVLMTDGTVAAHNTF